MLSLCNMLIVNFVPLPNFGEINIDKNFSFIYLILLFVCLVLLAPVNVKTPELQSSDTTVCLCHLGPRHQSPAPAARKTTSAPHPEAAACRRPAPVRRRSSNVTVASRLAAAGTHRQPSPAAGSTLCNTLHHAVT